MIKFDIAALLAGMKAATDTVTRSAGEQTLRAAGFAGAEVFRDEARANAAAHRRTGVLHDNIIVKRLDEEATSTRQAYLVSVRTGRFGANGDAFYWRWVENGHSFVRRRKKRQSLVSARKASALEYGSATVPAHPFMRPAFEAKKRAAIAAMTAKLAEEIAKGLKTT